MTYAAPDPMALQIAFQETLEGIFKGMPHVQPDSLHKMREKAWERYLALGLPSRKSEAFRYTKLRHFLNPAYQLASSMPALSSNAFQESIYPECKESHIVFVNGHLRPEFSNTKALPSKVIISPLKEAMKTFSAFLNNQWTRSLKEEMDPFVALNAALHPNGLFIYVPPSCEVKVPLQILNVVDHPEKFPGWILPRVHLFCGSHSKIDLVSSTSIFEEAHYGINQAFELLLEENAAVQLIQIADEDNASGSHLESVKAYLKRDSSLKTFWYTEGSLTSRSNYQVTLAGENCEAFLHGVWKLQKSQEAHTHILMEHQAPHCRSNQLFKGMLRDTSRSSFEGKILVQSEAQKTEAFQLNNNLLLSDRAHADSKPNLEIFADDVKATHGATMGQLNADEVFYLRSKGLPEILAQQLLTEGFCKEVLEKIPVESVRDALYKRLQA